MIQSDLLSSMIQVTMTLVLETQQPILHSTYLWNGKGLDHHHQDTQMFWLPANLK